MPFSISRPPSETSYTTLSSIKTFFSTFCCRPSCFTLVSHVGCPPTLCCYLFSFGACFIVSCRLQSEQRGFLSQFRQYYGLQSPCPSLSNLALCVACVSQVFAFVGTMMSAFIIGGLLYWTGEYDFVDSLTIGSLISATDTGAAPCLPCFLFLLVLRCFCVVFALFWACFCLCLPCFLLVFCCFRLYSLFSACFRLFLPVFQCVSMCLLVHL